MADFFNIMNYLEFLEQKKHIIGDFGFNPTFFPEIAFDFQNHVIEKAVKKGRMALFLDTGLGKTLIQLSIAQNVVLKTIEFEEYLEKCRRLAFDFFNVQIPLPNTQTEFNF